MNLLNRLFVFITSGGAPSQALVDGDKHIQADVLESGLPTGAATETKQDDTISEINDVLLELQGKLEELSYTTRTGDVEASPGVQTVLGRLKAIRDELTTVNLGTQTKALGKQIDDTGAGVIYIGEASPGVLTSAPNWRIKRITQTGIDYAFEWAGTGVFDQIWDNRVGLVYS